MTRDWWSFLHSCGKYSLKLKKIAALSYFDDDSYKQYGDDYDDQYEEYCRQYEDEKILYVNGSLPRVGDNEFHYP